MPLNLFSVRASLAKDHEWPNASVKLLVGIAKIMSAIRQNPQEPHFFSISTPAWVGRTAHFLGTFVFLLAISKNPQQTKGQF